jgi:hypothetical protein
VTNGTLLDHLDEAVLEQIDSLAVSVYPSAGDLNKTLSATARRCAGYGVRLKLERIDQFRRMEVSGRTPSHLTKEIFESCLIAHTWSCQTFYDGYFYLCSRPIYAAGYLEKFAQPMNFRHVDGLALHEPNLKTRLRNYLQSGKPLSACAYCLGTVGRYEPHRQLTPTERKQPPVPAPAKDSVDFSRMKSLLRWNAATRGILRAVPSRHLSQVLAKVQTVVMGD